MKFRIYILLSLLSAAVAWGRPAEIILLRHAEKPASKSDIHLSARGRQRAQALARLLTTAPSLVTNGLPTALFAAEPTLKDHGWRAHETLEPLARCLKVRIQTPYPAKDYSALAKRILNDHAYDGKTVVVCWVHSSLPELARALGAKTKVSHWNSETFDRVWLITYDGKRPLLTDLPQELLPGDSAK